MAVYFHPALVPEHRRRIIETAIELLSPLEPDCIAVRGCSGLAIGPIVADRLGAHLFIARKPEEQSHCYGGTSGNRGERIVILDDFISSGNTIRQILKSVNRPGLVIAVYLYMVIPGAFAPPNVFNEIPVIFGGFPGIHDAE